jgi:hypothetical protein
MFWMIQAYDVLDHMTIRIRCVVNDGQESMETTYKSSVEIGLPEPSVTYEADVLAEIAAALMAQANEAARKNL